MTRPVITRPVLLASLALLALAGCSSSVEPGSESEVAGQELALKQCPPTVPETLAVPAGNRLALVLGAVGEQIYACRQTATGYAWTFQAPEADLFKSNGSLAGSHYAGPTWETLDGSTVVGARVAGVTVDPTAIPWLLLRAVANSDDGRLSKVTFIHRLDTVGGLAPTSACDAEHVNEVLGSDYTADYYFYAPSHGDPSGPACD
jgi:hypothetical protein